MHAVLARKQAKIREDPELFAAHGILAAAHSSVATDHVADLLGQLTAIIADGAADGSFRAEDAEATARVVFNATAKFHHLAHAAEWHDPGIRAEVDEVCSLLLDGLHAPASP
ncbi:hypothetical protein [Nonomuraea rubra]|uniref:hypothetical protein n=1 Tax=Nonomuraea rubra TaxID=46180 RepID=UPI0033F52A99